MKSSQVESILWAQDERIDDQTDSLRNSNTDDEENKTNKMIDDQFLKNVKKKKKR